MLPFSEVKKGIKKYRGIDLDVTENELTEKVIPEVFAAVKEQLDILDGFETMLNVITQHEDEQTSESQTDTSAAEELARDAKSGETNQCVKSEGNEINGSKLIRSITPEKLLSLKREEKAEAVTRLFMDGMIKIKENSGKLNLLIPKVRGAESLIGSSLSEASHDLEKQDKELEKAMREYREKEKETEPDLEGLNLLDDEQLLKLYPNLAEEIEQNPDEKERILTMGKLNHELDARRTATHQYKEWVEKVKTAEEKVAENKEIIKHMESKVTRASNISEQILVSTMKFRGEDSEAAKEKIKHTTKAWSQVHAPGKSGEVLNQDKAKSSLKKPGKKSNPNSRVNSPKISLEPMDVKKSAVASPVSDEYYDLEEGEIMD